MAKYRHFTFSRSRSSNNLTCYWPLRSTFNYSNDPLLVDVCLGVWSGWVFQLNTKKCRILPWITWGNYKNSFMFEAPYLENPKCVPNNYIHSLTHCHVCFSGRYVADTSYLCLGRRKKEKVFSAFEACAWNWISPEPVKINIWLFSKTYIWMFFSIL